MPALLLALLVLLAAPAWAQTCPDPITFEGTQLADCFDKRVRGSELVTGDDQGDPCPGDTSHGGTFPYACGAQLPKFPALSIFHTSQTLATWLAQYKDVSEATGTYCTDGTDPMADGLHGWGVCARITTSGSTGTMVCGEVVEGKGTDLLWIRKGAITGVSGDPWTATGVTWTTLTSSNLNGALLMYGGAGANARCCYSPDQPCWKGFGAYQPDNACHANRWWVKVCLQVETLSGDIDRYTVTAGPHGSGSQIDASRTSPDNAIGTTYTTTWTGTAGTPRPSGVATSGGIGVVMTTSGGIPNTSVTYFRTTSTPPAPPVVTRVSIDGTVTVGGAVSVSP